MEDSKIAWTDNTFNPWIGCTRVSAGCEHCYAEATNKQRPAWNGGAWGPGAPRKVTSNANWLRPLKWNSDAEKAGKRMKVFCASLADIFDDEGPVEARLRLWPLIRKTPNLDWQILTKRPQNYAKYLPEDWGEGYANVWLGVSVDNRKSGYPRVDILRCTPAKIRFLSCEPLLENIGDINLADIDWVIVGGESGHGAREFNVDWARALRDKCRDAGIAFFCKQVGSQPTENGSPFRILNLNVEKIVGREKGPGKIPNPHHPKDIHGVALINLPKDLQIREWPSSSALLPTPTDPIVPNPSRQQLAGKKAWETRRKNMEKLTETLDKSLPVAEFRAAVEGLEMLKFECIQEDESSETQRCTTLADRYKAAIADATARLWPVTTSNKADVDVIRQCGHRSNIHLFGSDVRKRRWKGVVKDACRSICTACKLAEYARLQPVRDAEAERKAEIQRMRAEVKSLITSGEVATLTEAVEFVTDDLQLRVNIHGLCSGWWIQMNAGSASTATPEGQAIRAAAWNTMRREKEMLSRRLIIR